jgi:hypothetical protein
LDAELVGLVRSVFSVPGNEEGLIQLFREELDISPNLSQIRRIIAEIPLDPRAILSVVADKLHGSGAGYRLKLNEPPSFFPVIEDVKDNIDPPTDWVTKLGNMANDREFIAFVKDLHSVGFRPLTKPATERKGVIIARFHLLALGKSKGVRFGRPNPAVIVLAKASRQGRGIMSRGNETVVLFLGREDKEHRIRANGVLKP